MKILSWFCVCIIVLVGLSSCGQQHIPAASLWTDGAWALYEQVIIDGEGNQSKGTLKVSSVGKEMIEDKVYHWIELREDNQDGVKITKFLATENPAFNPRDSFKFWDDIKRIIVQENSETPEEVPAQHLKRFTPIFVESSKSKRFGNVKDQTDPEFKELGNLKLTVNGSELVSQGTEYAKNYTSSVNLGFINLEDTTATSTKYYLNDQIPFGGPTPVPRHLLTNLNQTRNQNLHTILKILLRLNSLAPLAQPVRLLGNRSRKR